MSSEDLAEVQKETARKDPKKKFLYILDACFSGSATDDAALTGIKSTEGILASSAEDEFSQPRRDARSR